MNSKLFLLVLVSLLMTGGAGAENRKIKGTGYLLVVDRPIKESFTRVSVQQGITLYVSQGAVAGITVEADDNILSHIRTEIRGGWLRVFLDPGIVIQRYVAMNVSVRLPVLTGVDVSSAARLVGDGVFRTAQLSIVSSSAADVKLELVVDQLNLSASGASRLELKGTADTLRLALSSSSTLRAWELRVENCLAEISGAAKAEVYVVNRVRASISASGLLIYDGNPSSIVPLLSSGGALVRRK